MKNSVNPVAIGMFVLAGAVIAVCAVMVFGAAKFFSKTADFVSYFSESVNGLDVGAPVKYKGVAIGRVESIRISMTTSDIRESTVAVVYSLDSDVIRRKTGGEVDNLDDWVDLQIKDGMRAKLNYQSIVTGMLYIELDYIAAPDEKYDLNYAGFRFKEIPSAWTGLAELVKAVETTIEEVSQIKFKEIGDNINRILVKIDQKIDQIDAKTINDELVSGLSNMNAILENPNIDKSLEDLDILLVESRKFLSENSAKFEKLSESANVFLDNINTIVAPQSPMRFELAMLLRSLNESMSAITNFIDYLQRNPSSIITGKAGALINKQ